MRWLPAAALLLPLVAGGCGGRSPAVPAPTTRPLRVMSVNQCTDQLVLALLPPGRIASVSWLAHRPGGSLLPAAARQAGVNHGLAEEVIAERPDLVVAGSFTTPALRAMLKRLRYPLVEVDDAASIADIRRVTRQVAAAVGEPARGEALIAAMDARLASLARDAGPPIGVVAWDRTGFAAGAGTLYDVILTAAGARNLVRDRPVLGGRKPDVEALLAADPALLIQGSTDGVAAAPASLGEEVMRHPLVRRYWRDRTLFVPQASYVCGTPMIADAALRLRGQLRNAIARRGPAPATTDGER